MTINQRALLLGSAIALTFIISGKSAVAKVALPQTPVVFSMHSPDGADVTSETIRGKVTVFAFGATWLPLSRIQVQGMKEVSDNFGPLGVSVFWVSIDSDSPKSKNFATNDQLNAFVAKNGIQVKVLRDPEGAISKQLGVDQIPAAVIIGKNGAISGSPIGGLDTDKTIAAKLELRLKEILKAQ